MLLYNPPIQLKSTGRVGYIPVKQHLIDQELRASKLANFVSLRQVKNTLPAGQTVKSQHMSALHSTVAIDIQWSLHSTSGARGVTGSFFYCKMQLQVKLWTWTW